MNAPLTHRLLILPLACAAFFAVACEVPPPDEGTPRLFATAADSTVTIGEQTTIAVRSVLANGDAGSGSVTATIVPVDGADLASIAAADGALTDPTAVLTLDATGRGTFDVLCRAAGAAVINFTGDDVEASATITCAAPETPRSIAVDVTDCNDGSPLVADGSSSCRVTVTVREQNVAAVGVALTAEVDEALAGTGPGNTNVFKASLTDAAALSILNLTTGAGGVATFFIQSPAFDLEQSIAFTVRDGADNSGTGSVVIQPFANNSSVSLSSLVSALSSGVSTDVTVTGVDVNTAPAAGKIATIKLAKLTPTLAADGCLRDNAGVLEATFGNDGRCTFTVTADTTLVDTEGKVTASFLAIADRGEEPRTAELVLPITADAVTVAQFVSAPADGNIFADGSEEPATSTTTVKVVRATGDTSTIVVSAVVNAESRGVIKLVSQRVGAAGPAEATTDEDTGSAVAPADGEVAFTVAADTSLSRGSGTLVIEVTSDTAGVITVIDTRQIRIGVDRQPLLSSLVFDAFNPDSRIGVPGGALPSSTGLSFKLLDEENNPVFGVPVRFVAQSSVPGVVVVPFATSNAAGIVNTVVTAGRVAGPITVVAIVDSPALRAVAPPVVVVGGLPNSAYSALICDKTAVQDPFTAECTVSLADKFTNVVETGLNVQFRAEGGNITPAAESTGGTASATFSFSQPGPGSADVRDWSYSPLRNAPAAVRAAFPGCFDRTTRTSCDLLALCSPAANDPNRAIFEAFCPLPPATGAASLCSADISGTTRQALIDEGNNPDAWELELFFPAINPLAAIDVAAQFAAYSDEQRLCGMPVSCLIGDLDGLGLDDTDNCAVNAGCLDFNGETECPQDGLLDILAAVRGEEGFDDENGNGVRDGGESFVDFPEPFLDKNSSCSFDSLNDNAGLTAGQKVQLSDLFIDSDAGDGEFGFGAAHAETNGVFDTDTEVFVKTSIVLLGQARLQVGEIVGAGSCGGAGATPVLCTQQATPASTSTCTENARGGTALLESCSPNPDQWRDGESINLGFRWTDASGNCPTEDFSGAPSVTAEGPVILVADDTPYNRGECGAVPGGIGASNPERPWCEEHPNMGAPIRTLSVTADCAAEAGDVLVKLTFDLDGNTAIRTFTVGCPVCGDDILEGDEQCDDGVRNAPAANATCDASCQVLAP